MNKRKDKQKQKSKDSQRKKGAPKWQRVIAEINSINTRLNSETPPSGSLYFKYNPELEGKPDPEADQNQNILETGDKSKIKIRFSDLPVSKATVSGLYKADMIKMTETQRAAIPHALSGRDLVVCARTGSGKTLSYLIPVVEKLYRERWGQMDGLGAVILVPTRELGVQAYEVLRSFGAYHDLSAGLVIGGKDVAKEKEIIRNMNILICTPGRLLQHMDETALFNGDNLQMLVLDEVDRLMDMGFKEDIDQIMMNIPEHVQTLLLSATIGRKVKDLAAVKLKKEHEYISVHSFDAVEDGRQLTEEEAEAASKIKSITPVKLLHYYMELGIEQKLDTLFSFLKSHPKSKCLVFFAAKKEVRFAYQAFKSLKLSQNLFELHAKMEQNKRTAIYFQFTEKKSAVLFATDVAARGIDFPAVDWVIQFDCPEDVNTYIHRVGRTARYKSKGNALMFLLPSERKFVERVQAKQISLKKLTAAQNRQLTIQPTLQKLNAENNDLMHLAKRSFITYMKSVFVMRDKQVFQFSQIDKAKLAESLGLASAPELDFGGESDTIQITKTMSRAEQRQARIAMLRERAKKRKEDKQKEQQQELWDQVSQGENVDSGDDEESSKEDEAMPEDKQEKAAGDLFKGNEDSDDDLLVRVDKTKVPEEAEKKQLVMTKSMKKRLKKITKDGIFGGKNREILDAEGKPLEGVAALQEEERLAGNTFNIVSEEKAHAEDEDKDFVGTVKERLQKTEAQDTELHKKKLVEKRQKKKKRMREDGGAEGVQLASEDEEEPAAYAEYSDEDQASEPSEPSPVPEKKKKEKKKGSKRQKLEDAEEQALALLNSDF